MCMLGLCIFFTSCCLPCLYICAHCYKLLTLKCTAFFVVPAPQYKQGSCVCASVLWFSVCALYECVYSRPKTMALSDYISLSVEAVKGGQENSHWLPLPSLLSGPTLWLAQATYIFRAWVHQNSLQLSNSAQELYTVWRAGVTKH